MESFTENKKKKRNSLTSAEELQVKLEEFKLKTSQVQIIKIINFLNFNKKVLDIENIAEDAKLPEVTDQTEQSERENKITLKDFIQLLNHPQQISYLERYNLFSLLFIRLSSLIFSSEKFLHMFYKASESEENDSYALYMLIKFAEEEEILVQKNWLVLILKFLRSLIKLDLFKNDFSHIEEKIHNFLNEVEGNISWRNQHQIEVCLNDSGDNFQLLVSLLEILTEISSQTEIIREHSKNYSSERNKIKYKINRNKKKGPVEDLEPKVIFKDNSVLIYEFSFNEDLYLFVKGAQNWYKLTLEGDRGKDFKAIRGYLINTVYLVKKRNDLIEFLKNYKSNSQPFNLKSFVEILDKNALSLQNRLSNSNLLLFTENEMLTDLITLKQTIIQTVNSINEMLKRISKTWHENEYIQQFCLVLQSEIKKEDVMKLLLIFIKAVEYPMDTINNFNSDSVIHKIISSNKDIISYYFEEGDNSNTIINLYYEKRSINKLSFMGSFHQQRNFYNREVEKIRSLTASVGDINFFLLFFRIVIGRYTNRKEIRMNKLNYQKNNCSSIQDDDTKVDTSMSVSFAMTRRSKIIEDDEEEEDNNLGSEMEIPINLDDYRNCDN